MANGVLFSSTTDHDVRRNPSGASELCSFYTVCLIQLSEIWPVQTTPLRVASLLLKSAGLVSMSAFSMVRGYCYRTVSFLSLLVTNHGIPDDVITKAVRAAESFFALSVDEKKKVVRQGSYGIPVDNSPVGHPHHPKLQGVYSPP